MLMRSVVLTMASLALGGLEACGHPEVQRHEAAGDSGSAVVHLLSLADSQSNRGQYDSARTSLDDEIRRAGQMQDSADVARGWTTLSIVARYQARFDEAQSLGEKSVALKRRLGLNGELARSLNALGLLANSRGSFDEALRWLHEALDAADAVHDSVYLARARNNTGLAFANMGDVDHARTQFIALRDFAAKAGDLRYEGIALTNLGMLETRAGDPVSAVSLLQNARARYAKAEYDNGEENALGQLGIAWHELGETSRALAYFDSALAIAHKDGLRENEADDLKLIAEVYEDAGDHKNALQVLGRARALDDSLGMRSKLGDVLATEARAYAHLGMPGLALARTNDAARQEQLADSPIDELIARLDAAHLARRAGELAQADSAFARAKVLTDNLGTGIARIQFALGTARLEDDARRSDEVLSTLDGMGRDTVLLTAGERSEREALRARALFRRGDRAAAAEAGNRAVASLERLRSKLGSPTLQTSYGADRAETYADLVITLLSLNRVDSAFRVADEARGRALIDRLGAARRELPRTGATGDLAAADSLRHWISLLIERLRIADTVSRLRRDRSEPRASGEIASQLAAARASYDSLLDRMARVDSRSAILGASTVGVNAVKASLAPDERLLEYFETTDRLLIFVVSRQSVDFAEVPIGSASIAEQARLARDLLRDPKRDASTTLEALYASLIAPLDERGLLTGARQLVIVPHGPLTYLSFAALRKHEGAPYLAEQFSITTLTSASAIVPLRARARTTAVGSRVFAPLTRELPASRDEAAAVASTLAVAPTLDSSASERALRDALTSSSIVHVASHGTLDAERPMFSAITVARPSRAADFSPSNDGRLETHEVLAMKVASRLVYLSGCETALGAATPTSSRSDEDYATLAQAFLFAGARDVVATLWRIDDEGAAEFAGRFYKSLRSASPAEALAQAQRSLIHDPRYSSPYYWAAYTVSGAGTIQ